MNRYLFATFCIFTFLFANTSEETILKQQFNQNILPQIIKDLNKHDESVIILRVYKSNKSITLKTYKTHLTFSKSVLFEKKGNYGAGFKYYKRYILKKSKIKVTDFLKMLNIKDQKTLNKYFENNAKLLLKKLKNLDQKYAVEGLETIIKKGKLNDLKAFLKGVLAGKVPASCS